MTALGVLVAAAVLAAWAAEQPAQAKEWPGGYDPATGMTWEQDLRYDPVQNPYGFREPLYSQLFESGQAASFGNYRYAPAPASYYYGSPANGLMPPADYSYGASAQPPARDNVARIRLVVPADARVWFDNKETKQTGPERRFESPALAPGRAYGYVVKAQWRDQDGRHVTRTRQVDVGANANVTVDLTR